MHSPKDLNFTYLLPLLMFVVMCCVFSVDIYVPSLPQMETYFATTEEKVQFTITAGMLGSMLLTIFIGPLSDAFGRRKLIVFLQFCFALITLLAGFSPDVETLVIARVLQGMANVAGMVLSFAIISDVSHGKMVAIRFSYITTTITTSLVFAPFIGGILADFNDWRYSFWLLSFLSFLSAIFLYVFLPETNKARKAFSFLTSTKNYHKILTHKAFLLLAFIPAIMIGSHIAFTTTSSFYFTKILGVSPFGFGVYQSIIMSSNTVFNYFSAYSIRRLGEKKTIQIGMSVCILGAFSFLGVTFMAPFSPLSIMLAMVICSGGLGFMLSSLSAECFSFFKDMSGAASSAMSLIRGAIFALTLSVTSLLYNGNLIVLSGCIAFATFVSVLFYMIKLKLVREEILS